MPSTLAWMEERIRRNAMANSRTTIFVSDWRISSNVGTAPDFTIRTLFLLKPHLGKSKVSLSALSRVIDPKRLYYSSNVTG
ncbi:hypothetical protein AtNW77_Chr5g0098151 [Arabidopsis thaliana]